MMLDLEAVQLQDQRSVRDHALVLEAAVAAFRAQAVTVPPAAGLHVGYGDQRLRTRGAHVAALQTRRKPITLMIAQTPSSRMKPYCRSRIATAVSVAPPKRFIS